MQILLHNILICHHCQIKSCNQNASEQHDWLEQYPNSLRNDLCTYTTAQVDSMQEQVDKFCADILTTLHTKTTALVDETYELKLNNMKLKAETMLAQSNAEIRK